MTLKDWDLLYDLPAGAYDGQRIDGVRTVTIRAGRSLEVMCHPIVRVTAEAEREAKRRRSTPAMERLNARNTQRHILRLIEENFTAGAVVFTGTYAYPQVEPGLCNLTDLSDEYDRRGLPWEMERVRKDVRNFLARLRRRVTRSCGRGADFRWIVRIEEGKEPPLDELPPKYHIHAVIEGPGISREVLEALWEHGRAHCDRLDLNDDGAARLSRYLTKQRRGGRWWSHSRNLRVPKPRISDRKVSRRRLMRLATELPSQGREILEKLYPGYRVVELPEPRFSDFASGAFIYARLRKRE